MHKYKMFIFTIRENFSQQSNPNEYEQKSSKKIKATQKFTHHIFQRLFFFLI